MNPNPSNYSLSETYLDLRAHVFETYLQEIFPQSPDDADVWAVLMETGYEKTVVTLLAVADSTASLYFGSGGGLLGSGMHEAPGKAARQLVDEANAFVALCEQTHEYPVPAVKHTRFYLLARGQVFVADALEDDLGNNRHPLSPLFYLAHELMARMREANPNW